MRSNGALDETTNYTQLNAAQLNLSAGNRISADMSVKDSAAVLAQQPGMGWIKQLQTDPNLASKIDWNKIEEAHQHWNYKQQGLTPAAAVVIAIVVAFFTDGAGTTTTLAGTTLATTTAAGAVTYTTTGLLINTAVTSLASQAAVSLINNGGRLDATLKELGSSDNLKQLATSLVTAGLLSEVGQYNFGTSTHPFTLNSITVKDSLTANIGRRAMAAYY